MNDSHGTGASVTGGIGAATVALLRERGARVAVLDLLSDNSPDGVHAVRCDITDPAAVDEAVANRRRPPGLARRPAQQRR